MSRIVLRTPRLVVRELEFGDAPFVVELLNDEAFLRHIGDRGVRTVADAREYLLQGPLASYVRHGHGLWCVTTNADGTALGICGLLKRPALPEVDLGFAFLPAHRGKGYAHEAAAAVLAYGHAALGLRAIAAIVAPDNAASVRVLDSLGMRFVRRVRLSPEDVELLYYLSEASE